MKRHRSSRTCNYFSLSGSAFSLGMEAVESLPKPHSLLHIAGVMQRLITSTQPSTVVERLRKGEKETETREKRQSQTRRGGGGAKRKVGGRKEICEDILFPHLSLAFLLQCLVRGSSREAVLKPKWPHTTVSVKIMQLQPKYGPKREGDRKINEEGKCFQSQTGPAALFLSNNFGRWCHFS